MGRCRCDVAQLCHWKVGTLQVRDWQACCFSCQISRICEARLRLLLYTRLPNPPPPLNVLKWVPVQLLAKQKMTKTCTRFRFGFVQLESFDPKKPILREDATLVQAGASPGQHLELRCEGSGASGPIVRAYTPVSPFDRRGSFDIDVRIYPAPSGRMGRYLSNLAINSLVACRGLQVSRFAGHFCCHLCRPIKVVFDCAGADIRRPKVGQLVNARWGTAPRPGQSSDPLRGW